MDNLSPVSGPYLAGRGGGGAVAKVTITLLGM